MTRLLDLPELFRSSVQIVGHSENDRDGDWTARTPFLAINPLPTTSSVHRDHERASKPSLAANIPANASKYTGQCSSELTPESQETAVHLPFVRK